MITGHLASAVLIVTFLDVHRWTYGQSNYGRLEGYTGKEFPDIRGHHWSCGDHITQEWRKTSLLCDPDELLNKSEGKVLA